jgi:hypothetical protein
MHPFPPPLMQMGGLPGDTMSTICRDIRCAHMPAISVRRKNLAHPRWGMALAPEHFGGSQQDYNRYLVMCCAILGCEKPVLLRLAKQQQLGRNIVESALSRFWKTGHMGRKQHAVKPSIYTEKVLEAAYEELINQPEAMLNMTELFALMRSEGHLGSGGSYDRFSKAFQKYCSDRGTPLTVGSTRTTFYLATLDYAERGGYARAMLDHFQRGLKLEDLFFVDECTLEETAHPKGRPRSLQIKGEISLDACPMSTHRVHMS